MTNTATDTLFWDRIAQKYATDRIKDMTGYERTIERSLCYLGASDHVLEFGCGTGLTALKIADGVESVVATDCSAEMIEIARERASARTRRNIAFAVATSEAVPYGDSAFDAVLAFNLLHLLRDRPSVLAQAFRLLKLGGLFISKTPCLSEMNPLIRMAIPVMRAIGKAPYVESFHAIKLEEEIAAAGFAIVERGRHGSRGKDARIFLVARKPDGELSADDSEPVSADFHGTLSTSGRVARAA